ncbi:unnamed protein product [Heligmosomoides polygyrus]|uniref:FH2 domain-containing protein n=1 Tax=Heligmosomoides polygyrus TaxID=6339 RepID=A0A183F561_HELPZ|nr:unnamed protein product [Heligmosomoides polygyrus]
MFASLSDRDEASLFDVWLIRRIRLYASKYVGESRQELLELLFVIVGMANRSLSGPTEKYVPGGVDVVSTVEVAEELALASAAVVREVLTATVTYVM